MKKTRKLLALVLSVTLFMVGCSVDQILTDINLALQTANVICSTLGAVLPADAVACSTLASVATSGLNAVQATYDTYEKSGSQTDLARVQAAVTAVQTNMVQDLSAAHIDNPATQQRIAAWVNLIVSTLTAVSQLLPKLQTTASAKEQMKVLRANAAITYTLTPEVIESRWSKEVCGGEALCSDMVKIHKVHTHGWLVHIVTFGIK